MDQSSVNANARTTRLPSRDETAALAAAGGDAQLARELLTILLQGLPGDLAELNSRFQAEDWTGLAATAHRIRGATSYCGVPGLDNALQELERLARAGERDRTATALQYAQREAQRLQDSEMAEEEP